MRSRAEDSRLQRQASTRSQALPCHQEPCSASCLTSSPDPDSLGSGVVDLTLWLPGECSLGLGYNLGFIRQEALSQAALCLIIPGSSLFTGHHPEQTHQRSILLTPSQSHNQYRQLTTLFIQTHLNCPEQIMIRSQNFPLIFRIFSPYADIFSFF